MTGVKTQIHPAQLEQIKRTGKSVYQFLQEAVAEKLKASKEEKTRSDLVEIVDYKFSVFEKAIESKLLQVFEEVFEIKNEVNEKITRLDKQIARDEERKEQFKTILDKNFDRQKLIFEVVTAIKQAQEKK